MSTENGNNLMAQGRIVWGSNLFEGKQKLDYNSGTPVIANDGQPVMEYGFGLAIPKTDPTTGQPSAAFTAIWEALHKEAFTLYPSGQLPPDFAMKFKDGDGIDHNGKPFADREGYKGHIVLTCTTQIPIKWFIFEGGNNILVSTGVKCGDYVEVQLNLKAHPAKGKGKAGLYLNPSAVRLIQEGAEIVNSPNGDQIFGAVAPPAYVGAVAPVATTMPNVAMPAQQAQPHYGVLPQTHQPVTQQAVPAIPTQQAPVAQTQAIAPVATTAIPAMPGMPVQ